MTHNITIVLDLHFSSVCDKLILSSFKLNGIYTGGRGRGARPPPPYLDFKVFR